MQNFRHIIIAICFQSSHVRMYKNIGGFHYLNSLFFLKENYLNIRTFLIEVNYE